MTILSDISLLFLRYFKPNKDQAEAAWMVASQEYFEIRKEV
jgi:hypothetical protein